MAVVAAQIQQPVYILDSSIYIFRSYFALPDSWFSPEGYSLNAVYGYTRFLIQLLLDTQPATIAAAFDESLGSCFRNEIYPAYKNSRALPDEDLAFQLAACQTITQLLGVASFGSEQYEADDIIATIVRMAASADRDSCLLTRDKDLGQLLRRPGDSLWDPAEQKRATAVELTAQIGVRPDQVVDFLALVGDAVDDIPGVPGIGKKTAALLLQQFGSIAAMQRQPAAVEVCGVRGAKRIASLLLIYAEQISMAQQLIRLHDRVPLATTLKQLRWSGADSAVLSYFLAEIGLEGRFDALIARLPGKAKRNRNPQSVIAL